MSKYTTEVRFICENYSGLDESVGYDDVDTVIANSRAKIFSFNYPIYDENYRSVIETKILKHFYTREIGAETVGLWKMWLDTRMNEIMPYYNKRYESTLLEYNPLFDTDITTSRETNGGGSNNASSSSNSTVTANDTNDNWRMYSDTPQGGLTGIEDNTYLTDVTHDKATNNGTTTTGVTGESNGTFTNTETYVEHITGKRGSESYSKLIKDFRDNLLNIDLEIIHELDDLFMNLW